MEKSIGFIGAGRITNILLQAFKNKKISLKKVCVFDTNSDVSERLKQAFPSIEITDLKTTAGQEIVFIALHPPVIMEILEKIKNEINKESFIISLAPKITINKISTVLGNKNIARLIPNATSVINQGYNPVCYASDFEQKDIMMHFLSALGKTFETEEPKLEAYAIASAMLPTYFWFQWFEMISIARQIGLSDSESRETIEQTILAALNTAFRSDLSQAEVLDLIPVKPIGENEGQIKEILQSKLVGLYDKIKP
jgi:pyrroline-5-carboxylate reductase